MFDRDPPISQPTIHVNTAIELEPSLVPTRPTDRQFPSSGLFACGSLTLPLSYLYPSSYLPDLPPSPLPGLPMDSSRPSSLTHFHPFAPSSLPSGYFSSRPGQGSQQIGEDVHDMSTTPTIRRVTPRKSPPVPRAPTIFTRSPSSPMSERPPRSRTPTSSTSKRSFSQRMSALPPYRSTSPIPLPRSRSRSSTDSSSSSGSHPKSSQQHGIGRKVAVSLDLFRETTSADELDNVHEPSTPLVASKGTRLSSKHHPQSSTEPQFSFFKRSEWPDREAALARREQSDGLRDSARTRVDSYSTSVSRGASDIPRRKARPQSVRENVIRDLVSWRMDVFGDSYQDRGRRRKRSLDSNQQIDPVDQQDLGRNESTSFRHPRGFQYSPSSSSPVSLTDIALTSPIVPSAIIADSPPLHRDSLPSANVPNSPYTTEDEDDESNWDDDTVSDSGTTASSNSPWPRSPLQGHASLSPAVKHSIHDDDHDDDEEEAGLVMPRRARQSTIPPELPDLPPDLSNFHDDHVHTDEDGLDHEILSGNLANLSHIPLRPFRNQVGGHSAIYKFTKRAVCKVCGLISFLYTMQHF